MANFWKPETCNQTVLPDRSDSAKIGGKDQTWKIQMRHFRWFSNTVSEAKEGWIEFFNFQNINADNFCYFFECQPPNFVRK